MKLIGAFMDALAYTTLAALVVASIMLSAFFILETFGAIAYFVMAFVGLVLVFTMLFYVGDDE